MANHLFPDSRSDKIDDFFILTAYRVTEWFQDVTDELSSLGRYTGPATLVLSSLADGPKHGYALIKDFEAFAGVHLAPGTLYAALDRLVEHGLIEGLGAVGRRRPYKITAVGATTLMARLQAQRRVAETGPGRLESPWCAS